MSTGAPEVHEYKGAYYMLATFTRECGLRATFILRSDSLLGPFVPHSKGGVTPTEWECLDGTLYVAPNGDPYIVFCHEHTQILDGTVCYRRLSEDLTEGLGEATVLFNASSVEGVDPVMGDHFVTDGPFMFRSASGELFMIWSSFVQGRYAEYLVRFADGQLGTEFTHLDPLVTSDGGHGMIFCAGDRLCLTFHSPNASGSEHPVFLEIEDKGDILAVK